jgi:hypothetical protein
MPIHLDLIRHFTRAEKSLKKARRLCLPALTMLSVMTIVQACAGGDESDVELEQLSQNLGELDGGSTIDASGSTIDASTGGTLAGSTGGTSEGGFIGGLGGLGGLLGGLGGLDGGFAEGGAFAGTQGGLVGGDGGFFAGGDGGVPGGPGGPIPFANWKFDDCGPSTTLRDSSPNQAHAVRSAQVSCAEGLSGGAVLFDAKKDTVSAAARAAFNATDRVAIAAWINPNNVSQGAVITKELNGSTAFELVLNNGNLIFRINIDNGRKIKQVTSKAPIKANRWTHVAALYDSSFVRLFEDGVQVGQIAASGTIADVAGPIQVGNNQANDFVHGRIDEVWLSRDPVSAQDIQALACIQAPPTLTATPSSSGPQEMGTSFTYDLAITNHDVGACAPRTAFDNVFIDVPGLTSTVFPSSVSLPAATTSHMSLQISSSSDAEPGASILPIDVFVTGQDFRTITTSVEYVVKEPTGCFIRTSRELMIRDLSVVEDPLRTTFNGASTDPRSGAWTFGRLMEQLAPTDAEAPDMVEQMFNTWLSDQTINGFAVPAKPTMQTLVLNSWPRTANGKLDLKRAPLRLLAIVNRIDSRNLAQGHAGEGRFVFGVIGPDGFPQEFTVIFEFRLPAQTTADVLDWANRWHTLGAQPFPSEQYNATLQGITDRFSRRGAEPARPNGSALAQLRTNEIALTQRLWELREFELSGTTQRLVPATVKLTPDTGFITGSSLVSDFVNENEASVLLEQHVVPEQFNGQRFLGGSSFNDLIAWTSPGIRNNEARHKFSLNTCNGCHSLAENGTFFLHVSPRDLGQMAPLSGFLQGTVQFDVVTGLPRQFNDLGRRNTDMKQLACPAPAVATAARGTSAAASTASRDAFIAKGIDRTH